VRAYAFAALSENPPVVEAAERTIVLEELNRMVLSAEVATTVRWDGNFCARSRRGTNSPANISVCFSESILTAVFKHSLLP
jgi:hypothetical protein